MDFSDVYKVIPNIVKEMQNHMLTAVPMPSDVKEAMFEIAVDSATDLDGYSDKFFKEAWTMVGDDLYTAIPHFFV